MAGWSHNRLRPVSNGKKTTVTYVGPSDLTCSVVFFRAHQVRLAGKKKR